MWQPLTTHRAGAPARHRPLTLAGLAIALCALSFGPGSVSAQQLPDFVQPGAHPDEDVRVIQEYFQQKFPDVPLEEFSNGLYALFPIARAEWQMIEEFPPYEPYIEAGEKLFNTPFANGKSYMDCFGATDVADQYPKWDRERGEVVTLGYAINLCREANNEKPQWQSWRVGLDRGLHGERSARTQGQRRSSR